MRTLVTTLALIVFVFGAASMATAQAADTLVAEGLALPKDHQYERYNASAATYGKVDVSQVPALVKQKQPIYDRTAKAWVYQSSQGLNPKYAAATPPAPAPATTATAPTPPAATATTATAPATTSPPATAPVVTAPAGTSASAPLVAEGLTLPKDHQYERYNASAATYGKVDVSQVPALVKQKVPIYDRTAKVWVNSQDQKLDPRYLTAATPAAAAAPAAAAPAAAAPAAAPSTPAATTGLTLPKDHQYERYNAGTSTYAKVDVSAVPGLVDQKVPIYDRTAKAWVYSTEQKVDPRYGSIAMPMANASTVSLALPKDHQYERYNVTEGTYARVDVAQVPTLVQQKVPIYDRTAKAWVNSTEQMIDPRYVAGGAKPK